MSNTAVIVGLLVISAVLPLIGLFGLWRSATREARYLAKAPKANDGSRMSMGQATAAMKLLAAAYERRPSAALRDFVLIGSGIVIAFIANVWSLFV
jgi:hypothetical protein